MPNLLTNLPKTKLRLPITWLQRSQAYLHRGWPFIAGIAAAFLALLLYRYLYPPPTPLNQIDVDHHIDQVLASMTPAPAYSAQVYQTILPSLVIIQSKNDHNSNENKLPAITGKSEPGDEKDKVGLGTGVVVSDKGDILTAYHVVHEATEIELIFADGSKALADIIAAEPENDIAVLQPRTPPSLIVPAVLGNPSTMRIGDEAYAVGNPLGLVGSMSEGIISGFDRSLPLPDSGERLEGLIQFDAAVNPGNSGGPLLNRAGQVVGIVTALVNPAEQNFFVGLGFAVPINTAGGTAGMPRY